MVITFLSVHYAGRLLLDARGSHATRILGPGL